MPLTRGFTFSACGEFGWVPASIGQDGRGTGSALDPHRCSTACHWPHGRSLVDVPTPYPQWAHFPRSVSPPPWVDKVVEVFGAARKDIDSSEIQGLKSDGVLAQVAAGIVDAGFQVESGKQKADRIRRPVLYGNQGSERVSGAARTDHHEGLMAPTRGTAQDPGVLPRSVQSRQLAPGHSGQLDLSAGTTQPTRVYLSSCEAWRSQLASPLVKSASPP